uniref:Cyclin-dependent kinase 11B n=1 Tax=Sinocyclocheilus grahami TaxID=75366 RepID=A0A672KEU4_SINGR
IFDEKETWKVKTLDEILQEKKRRRELEEKSDPKRAKNTDDRESKRDTPEEGELRDHRMEITIRNSPYTREDSTEDRGEEDESLAIKPPQQMTRKDKSYHRKEEKRKDKRRRRSLSAEGAGKHMRTKEKEKEREDERRKRPWREDSKSRQDYEREKRRDQARDHSRPVSHHRGAPADEYADKGRSRHRSRSRSPARQQREIKAESSEQRRVREVKMDDKNPLSELQDISDSERKTNTPDSSMGISRSGSEDEEGEENDEEESSSQSEADEEGESGSDSGGSEHSEGYLVVLCRVVVTVPESRFDHDSEVSGEEEEEEGAEEAGDVTPQSPSHSATPEDNYVPESPPISPVELKRELPKYLPALQVHSLAYTCLLTRVATRHGPITGFKVYRDFNISRFQNRSCEIFQEENPEQKQYLLLHGLASKCKNTIHVQIYLFIGCTLTLHLNTNFFFYKADHRSYILIMNGIFLCFAVMSACLSHARVSSSQEYSTAVDMWSVGCIFGELLTQKPLFPGKSEIDQINKVFKDLGSPSEKIWPGYSEMPAVKKMTFTEYPYNNLRKRFGALLSDQGFDLMNKFLTYCPAKRISADEALKHEYFRESPLPIEPSMFPTWPAKSEQQRVKRGTSPRPPEGGQDFSQLGDDDLKDTGFHLTTANQGASKAGPGFSLKF